MTTLLDTSVLVQEHTFQVQEEIVTVSLFDQGKNIGDRLETGLQTSVDNFLIEGVAFAYSVASERPWKKPEFIHLDDIDDNIALLAFLRASFAQGKHYKTAYNQASVVWMVVIDVLSVTDVLGIKFSRLVKLARVLNKVTREKRQELLCAAKTASTTLDFFAVVESVLQGVHIEPNHTKLLTGPESAIKVINEFLQTTKDSGDKRIETERISDALQTVMLSNEVDNANSQMFSKALSIFSNYMRRKNNGSLDDVTDTEFGFNLLFGTLTAMIDDLDETAQEEYQEIRNYLIMTGKLESAIT